MCNSRGQRAACAVGAVSNGRMRLDAAAIQDIVLVISYKIA